MIFQPIKGVRHLMGIGCGEGRRWWRVGNDAVCDQCGVRVEGAGHEVACWVLIDFLDEHEKFIDAQAQHVYDHLKVRVSVPPGTSSMYLSEHPT